MSTTPKKQPNPRQQDRSDVQSLLQVIRRLFEASQDVINVHTQTTLMVSVTLEAQMLLMKLSVMKDRWSYHPPFKEACKVHFDEWSRRMARMANTLLPSDDGDDTPTEPVSEYCPSKHFLLDLYETLPENTTNPDHEPYYKELSISKFVAGQNSIRKKITKNWLTCYEQLFSDHVAEEVNRRLPFRLDNLCKANNDVFKACRDTLQELSAVLGELHEMTKQEITTEQFTRLAERVTRESDYDIKTAKQTAQNDVHDWKNKTPRNRRERSLQDEIDTSIAVIQELDHCKKLFEYIGDDYDIKGHFADLGQFLHKVRCDISPAELSELMEQLYRIYYFREERARMQAEEVRRQTEAAATPAAKDALSVYQKRLDTEPQRPKLPDFFNQRLVKDRDATDRFYAILHHCGFYIGRTLLDQERIDKKTRVYKDWKWVHVRDAFINMNLIRHDSTKKGFADFLASVFPYLESDTVKRGFNGRGNPVDTTAYQRIVGEIEYEFEELKDIL